MLRKSVVPCFIPFGSESFFGTPSSRPRASGGMFHATQCTQVPIGASGSSAMRARLLALPGTSDQLSGGGTPRPPPGYLFWNIPTRPHPEHFFYLLFPPPRAA